jgi:hypothetical protein
MGGHGKCVLLARQTCLSTGSFAEAPARRRPRRNSFSPPIPIISVEGGATLGRSVTAAPYDARALGEEIRRLRPPLETITFIGMMFNSSNDELKHFFRVTSSITSAIYVAKRLVSHLKDLALYRRGVKITSGNALAETDR